MRQRANDSRPTTAESTVSRSPLSRRQVLHMASGIAVGSVGGVALGPSAAGALPRQVQASAVPTSKFNVRGYGATGDGLTDDSGPIVRAINAAGSAGGGIVFFPSGIYKVLMQSLVLPKGVRLVGASRLGSVILAAMSGDAVLVAGSSCGVEDLRFRSAPSRTTGAYIRNWSTSSSFGSYLLIRGCWFDKGYDCIVGDYSQDLSIENCNLSGFSHRGVSLGINGRNAFRSPMGNTYVSKCEISSNQASADAGIYVREHGGLFVSQVDIYNTGAGIVLDSNPDGSGIVWTFLDQVQCDSCARDGLVANGGGPVNGLFASNSWFSSNANSGINIGSSNTVSGVQLTGCQIFANGGAGVNLQSHAEKVAMTGCLISGNSRDAHGVHPAITLAGGIDQSDISISACLVGPMSGIGDTHRVGISFEDSANRVMVMGCSLSTNSGGQTSPDPLPTGVMSIGNV
jgi:Pectate lyase superfamily protein